MPNYEADIGTWEKGTIENFKASSDEKAIKKACKIANGKLVQIRKISSKGNSICIWDYVNGKLV